MSGPNNVIPMRPDVPIIGQPFTVRAWFPTALLNCNCDSKHAILIQGVGNITTCPSCKRSFMIQRMVATPTGDVGVEVAHVILQTSANGATPA